MITYSLDQIPFSQCGSFLLITSRNSSGSPRLLYKTCSARIHNLHDIPFPADEFFELSLIKEGHEVPYTWQAFPHALYLYGPDGELVSLAFSDAHSLIFQAKNVSLRLMPSKVFPIQYSPIAHEIYLIDWFARGIHMFRVDENSTIQAVVTPIVTGIEKHWGEFPCTITFTPKENTSVFQGAIRFSRYETFWNEPIPDFDKVIHEREKDIAGWMSKMPPVPDKYQATAEKAWYLLWSSRVPNEGLLTRQAIYMSKFWMNGIWAWDNLFTAMAIINADATLAWDQLLLFFDYQDRNGMVPDMISDQETIYGFTKPPIHGWAIQKMVNKLGVSQSLPYLNHIYEPLSRLTDWWYVYRDFDQDGMPQYFHGNDSGWDNATIFDKGLPVEGADLAAYLVLQCECLAFISETLGRKKAATRWRLRAKKQLATLLAHSVKDTHFFSPVTGTHEVEPSLSLINYMPLILGMRLPEYLRTSLIKDLRPDGLYLTQFGLASEPPTSLKYMSDGYWRGPIWAASTYIVFDGLVECGEIELARLIAERFCDLCQQVPGFWENYDALTGNGLRCPGYSWTASIFLLLAEWLGRNGSAG
jgi:putative isomerase